MFQDDIFPPCYAGSPAMSADEWQSGTNKPPVLVTITKDGLGGETSGKKIAPVVSLLLLLLLLLSLWC